MTQGDVLAGIVREQIEIAAPPEKVFRALTDPARLAKWWGAPDKYLTQNWQVDLRVGGRWSGDVTEGGRVTGTGHGEILELDPPRLLVWSWNTSWDESSGSTIRYELTPTATGTRVEVTHSGFARPEISENYRRGWPTVLKWLGTQDPELARLSV